MMKTLTPPQITLALGYVTQEQLPVLVSALQLSSPSASERPLRQVRMTAIGAEAHLGLGGERWFITPTGEARPLGHHEVLAHRTEELLGTATLQALEYQLHRVELQTQATRRARRIEQARQLRLRRRRTDQFRHAAAAVLGAAGILSLAGLPEIALLSAFFGAVSLSALTPRRVLD